MNTIFLDNKYTRWYWAIIERRAITDRRRRHETHHIIPRSLGGGDEPENLVRLTAREHFVCHWLLTRMTIGDDRVKMIRAFWMMRAVNKNQQRYINSRAYEALKNEYARLQSEAMMGENNPMYGTTWSDERKQAFIEAISGDNNPAKRPEVGKLIGDSKRGKSREQFSDEWIENLRKAQTGDKNGMYGRSHKEESKQLQREKAEKMAWVNDGSTSKRINKNNVQQYLDSGWSRGRHYVVRGPRGPYKKKQAS